MTPSVDVVIPLYNKRRSIARAVRSVLAQEHPDWRLIIVNDGSTDGSVGAIEDLAADARIEIVEQANAGPGSARNLGLRIGSAPFVAFLDADDEWHSEFLSTCLGALGRYPDCASVATSVFFGNARESRQGLHQAQGLKTGVWRCPHDLGYREFKSNVDFFHSSAVVSRRHAVERAGGFYAKTHSTYGEDGYLWAQILLREPIYRLVEPHIWFHTDFSVLGWGRETVHPIPPLLLHAEEVVQHTPASHRTFIRGYLEWYAVNQAIRASRQGARSQAVDLLRNRLRSSGGREIDRAVMAAWARLALSFIPPSVWKLSRRVRGVSAGH